MRKRLFIVLALAGGMLHAEGGKSYNARDYGAAGDGKTKDTAAIQRAIDTAAEAGGGVVDLPAGTYLSGSVELKSHVTLQVEAGATLAGSPDAADYPLVTARWEGIERTCHQALVSATNAEDIAVSGSGNITGNPIVGRLRNPRGPTLIEPTSCKNVRISGVTVSSTRMWTVHPTYCEDVTISGITTDCHEYNSDGIDPDSCSRVTIDHCTFKSGDDDIAIKSGKGQEGVRIGKPSEDITITNCTFLKGPAAIALGSELSGGIRRVKISHCTFENTMRGLYLKSCPGRSAYLQDVEGDHLKFTNVPMLTVETTYGANPDSQGVPGPAGLTEFSRVKLSDIQINSQTLGKVEASAARPLDGLTLENITGKCHTGFIIRNAKNVTLRDVKVEGIRGPAYLTENVEGTGLEGAAPYVPPVKATPAKK